MRPLAFACDFRKPLVTLRDNFSVQLQDIVADIPIPMRLGKGEYEPGVAFKRLGLFAENPDAYLDEVGMRKFTRVRNGLWLKFDQIALDPLARERLELARYRVADNLDVGPVTEADLCDDLFRLANEPF
jgi:hypothetical protein